MKKILYIFTALILLASCQKDNAVQSHDKAVATFEVQTPFEFEIKSTTGSGTGSKINALWYGVYHKKADGRFVYMSDMSDFVQVTDIKDISVPITLFKDQEYKIIFVAQHIEAVAAVSGDVSNRYTYIVNESGHMSLNPDAVITDGEQLDAFVYWEATGIIKNSYKKKIELTRPLAQINVSSSVSELPTRIDLAVTGTAASYNIFDGHYAGPTNEPISFDGLVCNGENLAAIYVLPAGNSVTLDMTMHYPGGTTKTKQFENIPVAPNYRTNVTGNI
jgi:hypothetical protein